MQRKIFLFLTLLLAMLFIGTVHAEAASVYYVRAGASGANNGSDWSNAYTDLPGTLLRGSTYYIASGAYASHTFNDAVSGTTLITIKKAIATDHGTDTGWNSAYGTGQASFGKWFIYKDYYLFDGQTRSATWQQGVGTFSSYGIKVQSSGGALRLDDGGSNGGNNLTFNYVDLEGGGQGVQPYNDVVYGLTGNKNLTFHNCALHDSSRTVFLMRGCWQNLLVEYSYVGRNASDPVEHGEPLSDTCSDNVTFRNNIIEDAEGTAIWSVMNAGNGTSSTPGNTADNWKIYGNVINFTTGYNRTGVAYIFFSDHSSGSMNYTTNLAFYNNTVNDRNKVQYYGIYVLAGSNNVVKNNIFYDTKASQHVGVNTLAYNWYYSAPSGDTGTGVQTCTTNCDIFVNRDANDLRLSGTNLPGAGDSSLGAEYNTDMNGNIRGADGVWDRGAYEFGGSSSTPPPQVVTRPNPPQSLSIQ